MSDNASATMFGIGTAVLTAAIDDAVHVGTAMAIAFGSGFSYKLASVAGERFIAWWDLRKGRARS